MRLWDVRADGALVPTDIPFRCSVAREVVVSDVEVIPDVGSDDQWRKAISASAGLTKPSEQRSATVKACEPAAVPEVPADQVSDSRMVREIADSANRRHFGFGRGLGPTIGGLSRPAKKFRR